MPRYTRSIESVAIRSGTCTRVMMNPFAAPQATPTSTAISIPETTSRPTSLISSTMTTADRAAIAPIERSIPRPVMTRVIPMASTM